MLASGVPTSGVALGTSAARLPLPTVTLSLLQPDFAGAAAIAQRPGDLSKRERRRSGLAEDNSRVDGIAAGLSAAASARQDAHQDAERSHAAGSDARRAESRDFAAQNAIAARDKFRSVLADARGAAQSNQSSAPASSRAPSFSPTTANEYAPESVPTSATETEAAPIVQTRLSPASAASNQAQPQTLPPSQAPGSSATVTTQPAAPAALAIASAASPMQPSAIGSSSPAGESGRVNSPVAAEAGVGTPAAPRGSSGPAQTDATGAARPERNSRSANAAPRPERPAEAADPRENIDRILRVLRGRMLRDKSTTVIRMDPQELGALRLELNLEKDSLSLRVDTQTDAAHRLLESELDRLRGGLEAAGIRLAQVEIRAPESAAFAGNSGNAGNLPGDGGAPQGGSSGDAGRDSSALRQETSQIASVGSDDESEKVPKAGKSRLNLLA